MKGTEPTQLLKASTFNPGLGTQGKTSRDVKEGSYSTGDTSRQVTEPEAEKRASARVTVEIKQKAWLLGLHTGSEGPR